MIGDGKGAEQDLVVENLLSIRRYWAQFSYCGAGICQNGRLKDHSWQPASILELQKAVKEKLQKNEAEILSIQCGINWKGLKIDSRKTVNEHMYILRMGETVNQ